VDEVARRVTTQALFLRHGENLPSLERLIGTYRDLLVVPCLLVGMIGAVSLASLLLGNVVSRARYLAILRAAGATRAHRVSLVVASGLILGGIGTVCGLAIGVPWSQVLTDLIAEMLGYRVAFRLDLAGTSAIVLAAIGLSVLSSLMAARPAMHPHTPGRLSLRD
jgi:ABC-type lipoprotein release transport system permease subunit